jgi:exodeoxyribonuclease VII large subunit
VSEASPSERDHRRIFGVSELLAGLGGLLEERVGRLWVVGEISNLHRARSGHCYFTLKDESGQLRAALFRASAERVAFDLEEGLEVLVYADVTIYAARGDLQLIVRRVEPRGRGALQLAFEQLRRRLESEGLFDVERKRELPEHPRLVGVVTSPTSAAVRDVIQVSGRRAPGTPLLISPTRVQGEGAGAEIAAALDRVAGDPRVEVVLLVRGGGSIEDLWAFNTEEVARAIERCPLPVVSGVGHETDLTIADLVADLRAPTPSAAAALALPDGQALAQQLARDWRRLSSAMRSALRGFEAQLARERDALRMLSPSTRLAAQRSRALALYRALLRAMEREQERRGAALARLAGRLDSLSPLAVLSRGYSLVERTRDGAILRDPADAPEGEALRIRLSRGELRARSEGGTPDPEDASGG